MQENLDTIILLHGILNSPKIMFKIESFFKQNNYNVYNIGYKSNKFNIETLSKNLIKDIDNISNNTNGKIHFITYSMGGLILRSILKNYKPKNLGKVIMIAPPNHGSEIADFLKNNFFFKKIFGPSGQQLATKNKIFKEIINIPIDFDLGIISGKSSLYFISSNFILPKPNDGRVSIESTKINGMKDHIILKNRVFVADVT